ncbi:proton channel OTOP1 [Heterodontus francisci]|uniref:proton channel OTOP1 n=1 Tax=Heterodontus francisci TaxID=7792 RepID=UPI00355BF63F
MDEGCRLEDLCHSKRRSSKCLTVENQNFGRLTHSTAETYSLKYAVTLSVQYGINVFVLGLVLSVAGIFQKAGVAQEHILAYLSTLMVMQLAWMLWYFVRRHGKRGLVADIDDHAGPRWLRGGLTLFAILSLVLDMFKIGYYIGYSSCLTAAKGVFPAIHAVHTFSQVYFLWFHAKDVIQTFQIVERFGMIHSVFTNLLLWVNGVIAESKHQLSDHKKRLAALGFANLTVEKAGPNCSCTINTCAAFYKGFYYMYPFSIEYHVFASAMLYIMWKNVGRKLEDHKPHKLMFKTRYHVLPGPVLGVAVFATTIGILIVYSIQVGRSKDHHQSAVTMFYLYSITVLCLMSATSTTGLAINRIDKRPVDNSKNPTRKLDVYLLVSTACASWLLSWCSVVAAISAQVPPHYTWLSLPVSTLVIIEKSIQNMFIIESLHRKRDNGKEEVGSMQGTFTISASSNLPVTALYCGIANKALENADEEMCCAAARCIPDSPGESSRNSSRNSGVCSEQLTLEQAAVPFPLSSFRQTEKLDKKRIMLKNITAFLFLCNISFWILPAFGAWPQFDNGLEENIYSFEMWILIVNLAMPFAIFYRMHASASLFEVFSLHKVHGNPYIILKMKTDTVGMLQVDKYYNYNLFSSFQAACVPCSKDSSGVVVLERLAAKSRVTPIMVPIPSCHVARSIKMAVSGCLGKTNGQKQSEVILIQLQYVSCVRRETGHQFLSRQRSPIFSSRMMLALHHERGISPVARHSPRIQREQHPEAHSLWIRDGRSVDSKQLHTDSYHFPSE